MLFLIVMRNGNDDDDDSLMSCLKYFLHLISFKLCNNSLG